MRTPRAFTIWAIGGCLLFTAASLSASAATDVPPQAHLVRCKEVLLTKVVSVTGDTSKFSITEVLKGSPHSPLLLKPMLGLGETFKPGKEYILCWMGETSAKDVVCSSMMEGTPEWYSIPVSREAGKIKASGVGSLDKVKEICASKSP